MTYKTTNPNGVTRTTLCGTEQIALWRRMSHLCEVSTTERPDFTMPLTQFQRERRDLGSIPAVGSSCDGTKPRQQHENGEK